MKYDVIIVGARCGGSSTALLLARRGVKVLLVDRAQFPSDTLSTHFLWPRGTSYLNRLGVLDSVLAETPSGRDVTFARDGIRFTAHTPVDLVEARLRDVHGDGRGATDRYASIRRTVLDKILLDAAIAAGAEFRPGVSVDEITFENGRAVGAAGERARIIVGADGRHSKVAQLVGAQTYAHRDEATFAYWTYFSGFDPGTALMEKRGRLAVVCVPTNFGANMTLVFGPKAMASEFKGDVEGNYFRAISSINPLLAELIQGSGRREEKFYGIIDQRAFKRRAAGPGWLLAGDAACIKDQCTAIGMTHAFRDAELAADAILRGDLAGYETRRARDLDDYYDFVQRSAGMPAATPADLDMMRAIAADPAVASSFAAMYGDSLPVAEFVAIRARLCEMTVNE